MKEDNPSKSPIDKSIFKENAGYCIAKILLLILFNFLAANVSSVLLRVAIIPRQASKKRWKTARKKRPQQAPKVEAAELIKMSGQSTPPGKKKKKVYLGIQDGNQSMSKPTTV